MKLTVWNGSPRGKKSNTAILLEYFLKGFMETQGNRYELRYIASSKHSGKLIEMFKKTDHVILAFPLYTDCMPGIVKSFIEGLRLLRGNHDNPSIGFIVQGGFPEAYHSRFVEHYLQKLAKRLNCRYTGCMIRGGFEATPSMPRFMTRKVFNRIYELGKAYGKRGKFDHDLLNKLAKPERLSAFRRFFFRFTGSRLADAYWNKQLKANNAFEKRFEGPLIDNYGT